MRDRVRSLVAEVLGLRVDDVGPDAGAEDVPNWDSLHHLELMLALEMEFGVTIDTEIMPGLLSVPAIDEYLRDQGVGASA